MKYRPSKKAIIELSSLISRGINDINSPEIQNSIFYKNTQTAEFLDVSNIRTGPQTLLLMAQIVAVSPTLHGIDISRNDLCESGPAVAEILVTSQIRDVDMSGNDLSRIDISEKIAHVFVRHNDGYSSLLSANLWMVRNLLTLPKTLVNLISSYATSSLINYTVDEMHGHSECGTDSYDWRAIRHDQYGISGYNWGVRRFEDGDRGYIWRSIRIDEGEPNDSLLTELARPEASALETMNANNTRGQNSTIANTQVTQQAVTQSSQQEVPTSLLGLDGNAEGLKVDLDTQI